MRKEGRGMVERGRGGKGREGKGRKRKRGEEGNIRLTP